MILFKDAEKDHFYRIINNKNNQLISDLGIENCSKFKVFQKFGNYFYIVVYSCHNLLETKYVVKLDSDCDIELEEVI